ncbi:MAG: hypothetical protein ACXAD7_27185 [Candidatus Kariarchaeaceae archaeon]|jgi:hypothetical protein
MRKLVILLLFISIFPVLYVKEAHVECSIDTISGTKFENKTEKTIVTSLKEGPYYFLFENDGIFGSRGFDTSIRGTISINQVITNFDLFVQSGQWKTVPFQVDLPSGEETNVTLAFTSINPISGGIIFYPQMNNLESIDLVRGFYSLIIGFILTIITILICSRTVITQTLRKLWVYFVQNNFTSGGKYAIYYFVIS